MKAARKIVTFQGGIHPEYEKELSSGQAIKDVEAPKSIVLPLSQHIGAPCKPVVSKGDEVRCGQLIGEPGGFVSAPIHASVSGKVVAVESRMHPTGVAQPAVVIEPDGRDDWVDMEGHSDPLSAEAEELKKRVKDGGLVGMGGAAFPSHVKLSPPKDKPIDAVLLNGAECEPYLTADDRLMREEPERILKGFQIVRRILGVDDATVCIEENKPEAIDAMSRVAARLEGLRVQPLEVKYPQGGEKQLIEAVLGRQVPTGGLPMDCGVVVFNVGTCAAIHDAVYLGKPLVERVTTVTGHAVKEPSNFRVRLGTPVSHLIEACGGYATEPGKVILGGPMMGMATHTTEVPVLKGTSGVVVQSLDEVTEGVYGPCIRCGMCVRSCPVRLTPNELGNHAEMELWDRVAELDVMDCIECGCCTFTCPSYRPLVQFIRRGKAEVRARKPK
jgi:electron transport complex protein RnfC